MTCKFIFCNYGFALSALPISCSEHCPGSVGPATGCGMDRQGCCWELGARGRYFCFNLSTQRSLHCTGEKLGSPFSMQEQSEIGPSIWCCPVHPSVVGWCSSTGAQLACAHTIHTTQVITSQPITSLVTLALSLQPPRITAAISKPFWASRAVALYNCPVAGWSSLLPNLWAWHACFTGAWIGMGIFSVTSASIHLLAVAPTPTG